MNKKTLTHVKKFHHETLMKALHSYYSFMEKKIENEAKDFKDHHAACKMAISHIEQLIKLGAIIDPPAENQGEADEFKRIIKVAMKEVKSYQTSNNFIEDDLADAKPSS